MSGQALAAQAIADHAAALGVAVASVSADSIDRSDIRKASLEAMRRALAGLPITAKSALADGRVRPPRIRALPLAEAAPP